MSVDLDTLIPHRPPMQWISELIDCTETTATAVARFTNDHFATADGFVLETALVECVAQTVAAAMGHRARSGNPTGTPAAGMLTGVSNFKVERRPSVDEILEIEVRELKRFGMTSMVTGTVRCDEQIIASGELTFYA